MQTPRCRQRNANVRPELSQRVGQSARGPRGSYKTTHTSEAGGVPGVGLWGRHGGEHGAPSKSSILGTGG